MEEKRSKTKRKEIRGNKIKQEIRRKRRSIITKENLEVHGEIDKLGKENSIS
jgi:hypothetical protein